MKHVPTPPRFNRILILALLVLGAALPATAQLTPNNRMCDPAYEDCRAALIQLIDNENIGIDVGFWFMEDRRFSEALIRAKNRGVSVRVVFDLEAITTYGYPNAARPVQDLKDAGVPMRQKTGTGGIFHFKTMIFEGQNVVEFSGANFSPEAFVYQGTTPYANYVDEVIMFSEEPGIVGSFKTRFDDVWTDVTTGKQAFSDYANITGPLVRRHATWPIDPELQFSPWTSFASRIISRYRAETIAAGTSTGRTPGIDAIMYRITDQRHTNEMIAAGERGVEVRLISEQEQYRSAGKYWHSWNIDRMYMAGVQQKQAGKPGITIKHRKHGGQSHEKLVLLRSQQMAVLGSSNWTSASDQSQHEHNRFTTQPWVYDWSRAHFDRKWFNTAPNGVLESENFVPLPPDTPVVKSPANAGQNQPLTVNLQWDGGLWAHAFDLYFGTDPMNLPLVANVPTTDPAKITVYQVTGLVEGTTYYWKVVGRTMAEMTKSGPVWSFRTQGEAPSAGGGDAVLHAWRAPSAVGWSVVNDATAAGGKRLSNPNVGSGAGAPKLTTPLASPSLYFEMGFVAEAGIPYRLWIRGKATANAYDNDSVYVQFNNSVNAAGTPMWRIDTTSAATVTIEDCARCLANWGWNDTAVGGLGPVVYFAQSGAQKLRVQVREDGLSIDQIILSSGTFLTTAPGPTQNDGNIYTEQNVAPLDGNLPPTVSITSPAEGTGFTAPSPITITADAADPDGTVTNVEFFVNGMLVGADNTAPYSVVYDGASPGQKHLTARVTDNRGEPRTSTPVTITLAAGSTGPGEEVVLYASTAPVVSGWTVTADAAAAGGFRLQNPNLKAAKVGAPLASPTQYFEMTFEALAGRPYRLWVRGRALSNQYEDDSIYVQFDNTVAADGVTPATRIGTTAGHTITLEDCSGCGLAAYGWQDNASTSQTTPGVLGPPIYFATSGLQTIRVQIREDGIALDQIVLSSVHYLSTAPGLTKNDTTILPATP